ncbi:MAG: ComF family protein [Clostridia bacterium]|nr:ComF family protein [Clostridia bacterium]
MYNNRAKNITGADKHMIKTIAKFLSYGCLNCGRAVHSKRHVLCSYCESYMKAFEPNHSHGVISAISYSSSPAKNLIRYMKDYNDPYVFDYAAKIIAQKLKELGMTEMLSDFYITYAPRSPLTLLKKRFDQSKEMADFLAIQLFDDDDGRVVSLFKRYPFASEQKSLNSSSRKENAREIFSLKEDVAVPEKILLIDDLTTTGSTLFSLRDILYDAGVKECILCTLAVNDNNPSYF